MHLAQTSTVALLAVSSLSTYGAAVLEEIIVTAHKN